MFFSKLFKRFIQETRPVFPPGLFLTGGRAIKFSTHGRRSKKLPSADYDFKYVTPKKPNVDRVCSFFDALVNDFVAYTGLSGIRVHTRRRVFSPPILQNPYYKRYSYGFCDFGLVYRGKTHDLVDVVMMKGPIVSLDKNASNRYGLPIPTLEHLYEETAMVVAKTLVSSPPNRNSWRNPLESTSEKHKQKGKRNVNRLVVMNAILNKKNQNLKTLQVLVNRPRLPMRTYIGKLVGEHMLKDFLCKYSKRKCKSLSKRSPVKPSRSK